MNHENYHQRLDFVKSILQLNGLEVPKIETVEYNMNSKHPYNNYIYLVTLPSPPSTATTFRTAQSDEPQPGTVPMPANTKSLILRLANADPRTGMNNTNRVENEVASMTLARQALTGSKYSHIVPDIYAWASVATGQGFTVQQYMHGIMPDKVFKDLTLQDKSVVLAQMADILALFQKFKVPQTIDKFGGLRFDDCGNIISAQMTIYKGEPSATYSEFIRAIFSVKLQEADENPVMQGWTDKGVRARLDNFINSRLGDILKEHEDPEKVLVHSDFSTNNLLFDPSTLEVTAILDFDFSYVGTIVEEFMLFSFGNMSGGQLPGPLEDGAQLQLRNAMLNGYSRLSSIEDTSDVEWDVAKAWDDALAQAGAARPQTISNFERIADTYWFTDILSPFELDNPLMRKRRTAEQLKAIRERTENLIVRFLDKYEQTL
ncbi:uncharacterized protein JN550_013853 [Neoarthrinium moseri]|uniref:uncharacterized protein n=1 Tax=Neoarthrinium moseri TaxID=1658444 RepID=UPI001FDB3966|nr:uncharacterized protein JN550_013853 [Neoarthrinium moseri]KAI1856322.1 hypothetical protein JN550_013853 [Neoarthrinium moseri]